jgi:hypothetical protein
MLSVTRVPPTYCRALCAFKQAFRYDPNFISSAHMACALIVAKKAVIWIFTNGMWVVR